MLWSHGGSIYYKPQMFIYINTYKYATILSVRSKSSTVSKFYFWSQRNTHHCHGDMPDLEGGFRGTAFEEDPWAHSWLRLTTLWSVPSVSNWTLKKGGDFRNNLNSDSRELKRRQARVLATQAGEWRVKIQDGRDWGDCPQRASPHNCVHPWSLMGGCASWDQSWLMAVPGCWAVSPFPESLGGEGNRANRPLTLRIVTTCVCVSPGTPESLEGRDCPFHLCIVSYRLLANSKCWITLERKYF